MFQELDFEDELRGIEGDDSGDKNPYDAGKTSILAAVPVRNAEIVSPSAKSRDDGSRNKRHATPSSPSSRTSKAAGADKGRRQSDRQEPLVNTSQNQDETENKTGRDSKNFTEDDTLSRRRSHYRSNDENHNAEPRNRGLPTSVMERANEDPNDWPEVSGNPTSRDVRKDSTGNDGDGSWRNQDEQSSGRDVNSDRNSERDIRRRSRDELRDGADAGEKYLDRDHDGWSAHGDRKDWVSGMGRNKTKYRDSARERGVEKGTEVFRTSDGRESSGGAYLGGGGGRGYGHGCNQGENHGDSEDRWHQRRIHLEGERVSRDSDRQAARGGRDHWESMKMEGQHQQHQLQLQHQLLLQQEAVARTKDLETKVRRSGKHILIGMLLPGGGSIDMRSTDSQLRMWRPDHERRSMTHRIRTDSINDFKFIHDDDWCEIQQQRPEMSSLFSHFLPNNASEVRAICARNAVAINARLRANE